MPDIDEFRGLVGEDPRFQRRVWVAQRAGWAAMAAFVLLAVAGGLGDGPLSAVETIAPGGALRIRHEGVARQDSATRWQITLPPGDRDLVIRSSSLSWIVVLDIQPAPERQVRAHDALELRFAASGLVTLTVEPDRFGLARVEVVAGDAATAFRTLVLP